MTNRELLAAARESLTPTERQKQYLLRAEASPMPCPACLKPVGGLAASGTDLDAFDFGRTVGSYSCPHCAARLVKSSPDFGVNPGWHWHLDAGWLAEQLAKARAYDRERGGG